jgi:hypothetical protein
MKLGLIEASNFALQAHRVCVGDLAIGAVVKGDRGVVGDGIETGALNQQSVPAKLVQIGLWVY